MSGRNAKLLRRFAARERRHGVVVFVRDLGHGMARLSHRDRGRVRRLIAGTIPNRAGGARVPLRDGPRPHFDVAAYAARLKVPGKGKGARP